MTAPLVPGEATIRHQVKIPESLDRKLRARAVTDGDLKISEVIRRAIEAYLDEPRRPEFRWPGMKT